MERFKFTKTNLKTLASAGVAGKCSDQEVKELYFEITSSGGQFFRLIKKFDGKKVTVKLGDFQTMTVEQARNAARNNLEKMRNGINPNAEKKAKRDNALNRFHYSDIFEAYRKNFEYRIKVGDRRQLSLVQADSVFKHHTNPVFLKKDVRNLTSEDTKSIINKLKLSKTPPIFNKCLTQIKAVFNYAKTEGLISSHYFDDQKKFSDTERERVLTESEEARLLEALEYEDQIYRDLILIALFTGQRKHSILSLKWQEIDPQQKIWVIPAGKAKSKKSLVVPLIAEAMAILTRRSKEAEEGEVFVFPNKRSKLGHVTEKTGEGSFWRRTIRRAGLYSDDKQQRLTFHDLRRSTATRMARAGVGMGVIQRALGHSSIAITSQVYARHDVSQIREGLELGRNKPVSTMDALKQQLKALTPEQRLELLGGDV
jgi:integrase